MFCYQCEQTDRTPQAERPNLLSFGCSTAKGNCGKDATTAALQDVLVEVNLGIGQYAQKLRELGAPDPQYAAHCSFDLFTTLTNVNFNATRFMSMIADAVGVRERAKAAYEAAARAAGSEPETLCGAATFEPATKISEVVAQATEVIAVEIPDRPGGLNSILHLLDGAAINIEYMYAFVERMRANAVVIFKIDDPARAAAVLTKDAVPILSEQALRSL